MLSMLSRFLLAGAASCAVLVGSVAAQRTIVVDSAMAAGADYPDIDVAYAASQPGDWIHVRPGTGGVYAAPREMLHGVRMVGLGAAPIPVYGDFDVRWLPADQIFLAHNLDFGRDPTGGSYPSILDCDGLVLLSRFYGNPRTSSGSVGATRSDRVVLTDFELIGGQSGAGFLESRGIVADCIMRPAWGTDYWVGYGSPCNVLDSEVWVVGGVMDGGDYLGTPTQRFGPDSAVYVRGRSARVYLTGGVEMIAGERAIPLRNSPCPPDEDYWWVFTSHVFAGPEPNNLAVVRDPNISTRGCWRNPYAEVVHEFPTVHPGDAHPGQPQTLDVIGPTSSVVSLFASLIHNQPPVELPIGDVWLDPSLVVEIGCGAVDANREIRFQTRIPDWMQPGEAFVYQVTALSPGGAWEIGPPGFAVVW